MMIGVLRRRKGMADWVKIGFTPVKAGRQLDDDWCVAPAQRYGGLSKDRLYSCKGRQAIEWRNGGDEY
ncbi:hypothetical protein [Chitinophaga rhizophila]|uniref:Uncharacterized protein n=1 Tax=Chitinophaga rhizophila TaxID=2866212 RepID=A0ABS7GHJ3_9BACT|nr:hypothetical protein [Chitinophaga rhizophila]MBW8687157.1 hypothetical protein [Chitinophaga rhizophila]